MPQYRIATEDDLYDVVRLLVQDQLGSGRETLSDPLPQKYLDAFNAMQRQDGNDVIVQIIDGKIVGCYQLTVIHGISRSGSTRAQIEGVRVDHEMRGSGLGHQLFEDAIERSRQAGCQLVQLTTDKSRDDAHRFYEQLGFEASHIGYKLAL